MSGSGAHIDTATAYTPQPRTSHFHGLTWLDDLQAWKIEIVINGNARWIGCSRSEVVAAIAFDEALYKILCQDPSLRLPGFNFGVPRNQDTLQRREVALAAEAREGAQTSLPIHTSSSAGSAAAASTSAPRRRHRTLEERQESGHVSEQRKRSRSANADSAGAAAAAPAPALGTDNPTAEPNAALRAAVCTQMVEEIYQLHWICADQRALSSETSARGFFKLKISVFGISWAFAFRAQPNYDYPIFLHGTGGDLARVKLLGLVRAFFDQSQSIAETRHVTELMACISLNPIMPYHPAIYYSHELILDENARLWAHFPFRFLNPPPPPGPLLVPMSPRASPSPRDDQTEPPELQRSTQTAPMTFRNELSGNHRDRRSSSPANNNGTTKPRYPK